MQEKTSDSNIIAYVNITPENMKYVKKLVVEWGLTSKDVCCYIYMLLLTKYTGVLTYQLIDIDENRYVFLFDKDKSIQENLDAYSKRKDFAGQAEIILQECKSVTREFTFWIENDDNGICIKFNLNRFTSFLPPYLYYHYMYCLEVACQEEVYLQDMRIVSEIEKGVIESFFDKKYEKLLMLPDYKISNLFSKIVRERATYCAVEMNGIKLTYSELDQYSDQAAVALQRMGVVRNDIVGVMMHTDIDLIVWVIGIIKLNAVYMPIDIDNPTYRNERIVKESKTRYIIGTVNKESCFSNIVFVDKQLYKKYASVKLISTPEGDLYDGVYVIHTSGSTGNPKGIIVNHSNLLHQIFALKAWGGFPQHATSLLSAHYCFDVSLQQIFFPLLTGGTICILPKEIKMNGRKVIEYINERKLDIVNFVPSYLEVLLEHTNEKMNCGVLLVGGEVFNKKLLALIRQRVIAFKICNIYGLSETTINTTIHVCGQEQQYETIPIGKPLMYYYTYVVNRQDEQVPIGVNGELYISGPGVVAGYMCSDENRESRFAQIEDLDSNRLFKTGDLVSWNQEGELLFVGRRDLQIKIYGKRFEIEAIEKVITDFEKITAAVVLFVEQKKPKLIAYFTAVEVIEEQSIKEYLKEYFQQHMIPIEIIQLDYLPITNSGKVDREYLVNKWKEERRLDVKDYKR